MARERDRENGFDGCRKVYYPRVKLDVQCFTNDRRFSAPDLAGDMARSGLDAKH